MLMQRRWHGWRIELADAPSSYRRTPDELRTLYMLYPDLRDVIVEGRNDAKFFKDFLNDFDEIRDVNFQVYAVSDRVDISNQQIIETGFEAGQRGRVLTLAEIASSWEDRYRLCLTCIVDADRACVQDDIPESDVLLVTDFGGLECYALTSRVMDKFISVTLRRDDPTGIELVDLLIPLLNAIFCARAAVHFSSIELKIKPEHIKDHSFAVGSDHSESLIRRLLPQGGYGLSVLGEIRAIIANLREKIPNDEPLKAVRGHDIAPLIINVLDLPNRWADHEVVEGALMGCVEHVDVENHSLFSSLVSRVLAKAG